jgi:hypothetical protein
VIRDVLGWLDYSACAQIALVLFVGAFAAEGIRLWFAARSDMERFAALPLNDGEENQRAAD